MAVVLLWATIGCGRTAAPPTKVVAGVDLPPGFALLSSRERFLVGASGLTVDPSGKVWTVTEDSRALLALSVTAGSLRVEAGPVPIEGIDAGLEAESIVAVDGKRFAIGTEGQGRRKADKLFLVEVQGGRARVARVIELSYRLWGIQGEPNKGIEGVCYAKGRLLVALEPVLVENRRRYAPLARFDLETGRWQAMRLRLTTGSGKLAGLSCRARPGGGIAVVAIERHYGIARLLQFVVPDRDSSTAPALLEEPSSRVLLDLAPLLRPLPNFEGVARAGETLYLISDNHQRSTTGSTYLVRFKAR